METFAQFYERRSDYVYFMCSRLEFESETAQRLNQAVWRRIRRQLPQMRGKNEEQWLCSKIVDAHRKVARSTGWNANQNIAGVSEEQRVINAVMMLGLEYRWPLVFREFAGFGYSEIAGILGVPEGTVRARMGRARSLLRRFQEESN